LKEFVWDSNCGINLAAYLTDKCPWVFESHPISYRLVHNWLENYTPHDFGYGRWKYLSVDPAQRRTDKENFKPLNMNELRGKN